MSQTDAVRKYVGAKYIEPARRIHRETVRITAGDIHRELKLRNRMPLVCSALRSRQFLEENHLEIANYEGPPSRMSNTVTYTYRLLDPVSNGKDAVTFLGLRGIARDIFRSLGGGEAFIRGEREQFEHRPEQR